MKNSNFAFKLILTLFLIILISKTGIAVDTFEFGSIYNFDQDTILDYENLNIIEITQKENHNYTNTIQNGYSNKIFIFQLDNNELSISQKGIYNIIKISQNGKYNNTIIKQSGISKITEVNIYGSNNSSQIIDNRLFGKSKLDHSADSKQIKVLFKD